MEDQIVSDTSSIPRSESKLLVGDKRSSDEFGEESELGRRRVKMRDLESLFRSEENIEGNPHLFSLDKDKFQVSNDTETLTSDVAQGEITRRDALPELLDTSPIPLDLNTKVCVAHNSASGDTPACAHKLSSFEKYGIEQDANFAASKGFGWDLNAEDVSSSLNQNPFYPFKNIENLRPTDASECGSSTGPLEEKDSMRVWKEMKQNGFISASHGGIPVPKPHGRKKRIDGPKQKMELAKREQVDRFAKIAAPSGLLNELNPGIINHVRNSKQVLSIIEALVRSEKRENHLAGGKQAMPTKSGTKEISDRKDLENANDVGMNRFSHYHERGYLSTSTGSQTEKGFSTLLSESVVFNLDHTGGDGESSKVERRSFGKACVSSPYQVSEDDRLALKLSSSTTMASENTSSLSNEESANVTTVSSLSVKAANVASQWLELLYQDTKGRLAALQRSKKRVRAVIHTELPFLISQEFSSNQENDQYAMKNSAAGCSGNADAEVHQARWSALFHQMDKALSEEEKQLESWLNQVQEMKLHCEWGLQHSSCNALHGSQRLGTLESDPRSEERDNSERELAVQAAAASIYSTSNFLLSKENCHELRVDRGIARDSRKWAKHNGGGVVLVMGQVCKLARAAGGISVNKQWHFRKY
ncbi:Microtubule-actin cross-linking factor 1, like [Actinidia chinensis var. chinensis]|uniref:Microtubule-actin cross-linking factor 1, like n=1 Tax=Actinidia chinensis var. chinensis TaxID=1590841 RepID=A0A2R6RR49_ACTCC|nr:Microtubule-actin cross-linking factor 1, like [Actinidia chinensis var. chinensis]